MKILALAVLLMVPALAAADAIDSHPNAEQLKKIFATDPPSGFKPTGVTRADYLKLIAGNVDLWKTCQIDTGAIVDPLSQGERQYSTPAFAAAAGLLVKEAGRKDLLEPASKALSCALAALLAKTAADNQPDFYIPLLMHAYRNLKDAAPKQAAGWAEQLRQIDPAAMYRAELRGQNVNLVSSCGELLRRHDGLVSKDQMDAQLEYLEGCLDGHLKQCKPIGLFEDPGAPMAYDAFSRLWLEEAFADDAYTGRNAQAIGAFLTTGGLSTLMLLSPSGEWASGGRSGLHQWTDLEVAAICEMNAVRWHKAKRDDVAGCFKRAARLAFQSAARWARPTGELNIVKNRPEPDKRFGYEKYSNHCQYNLLSMAMLAIAYSRADDTIDERPTVSEVGGYVFDARDTFHEVAAAAGGYYVLIDTAADPLYNATGLQRVHEAGVMYPSFSDTAAAERLYEPKDAPKMALAPGIQWQDSEKNWIGLADFGGKGKRSVTSAELQVVSASPKQVEFQLAYSLAGDLPDQNAAERYSVSAAGVTLTSRMNGGATAFRAAVPVLVTDAAADTKVTVSPREVSVSQRGSTTTASFRSDISDAKVKLLDDRTITHSGEVQPAVIPSGRNWVEMRFTLKQD